MNQREDIKRMLDKYLDGLTNHDEEAALREYFAGRDNRIPEEWKPFKALFAYVDEERYGTDRPVRQRRKTVSRLIRLGIAAAAVVLALVTITLKTRPQNFVIIDGAVYRDKQTVENEALKALDMVSYDNEDTFGALETLR